MAQVIEWKTASEIIEMLTQQNALVSGMSVAEAAAALGFSKTASGIYVKTVITTAAKSIAGASASAVAASAATTTATTTATNLALFEGATGTASVGGIAAIALPVAAVIAAGAGGYLIGTKINELNPPFLDEMLLPIFNFVTGNHLTLEDVQETPTVPVIFDENGNTYMDSRFVESTKTFIDSKCTTSTMWSGYPESSNLLATYPYQVIAYSYYTMAQQKLVLAVSPTPIYYIGPSGDRRLSSDSTIMQYSLSDNIWTQFAAGGLYLGYNKELILQSNSNIYNNTARTTLQFAKNANDPAQTPPVGVTKYIPGTSPSPLTFPDEVPSWVPVVIPRTQPGIMPTPSQTPDTDPDPEKITPFINPVQPQPIGIPIVRPEIIPTIPIVPVVDPTPDTSIKPVPAPDPSKDPSQVVTPVTPTPESEPLPEPIDSGVTPIVPIPVIPTISSEATGLLHVYNPTNDQINQFGSWLWTTFSGDLIETLSKLFNNPMDAVIGLHELYSTPTTSSEVTIKAGYLDSGVASRLVSSRYTEIKCGALSVPEYWGNYLDYSPYTKTYCYLPFIGIVELNTDDIVGSGVEITYKVDSYNGSCIALITTAKSGSCESVTYEFSGNCAVEIPITSGMKSAVQGALIGAATMALAASTGGGAVAAATMVGGVRGAASKNVVQHSGSFGSSYGAMGIKKPFLIVKRPKQKVVYGYNTNYGYPAHKMVRIGDCTGYLKAIEVDVISPTATENEKSLIEKQLKSGIFVS